MTLHDILQQITRLSDGEKLAVIEATARMLRQSVNHSSQTDAIAEVVSPYRVDDVKEFYLVQGRQKMAALAAELSSRPNPPPEEMLPRGILKGLVFDEEDFRAAEWHPTDEELAGE